MSRAPAHIRVVAETGSTNADMKALALSGEPEGLWLRAERQTSGKGRLGRAWEGDAGNLFASSLVRLGPRDSAPQMLGLVTAVAVHEALSGFVGAGTLQIKWPNDVMARQAKLCGMLLERAGDAVIIGIGVNVVSAPLLPDRATIALQDLGAKGCDAQAVLEAIAVSLAEWLGRWRTYGAEPVIRAWEARAHPRGTALIAYLPDGTSVSGRFERLDESGALILRLADGAIHAIHAGDVFCL